jgi:hypothetical protein
MKCCNEAVGTEGAVKKIKQEQRCGELILFSRDEQELEGAGKTQDIRIRLGTRNR